MFSRWSSSLAFPASHSAAAPFEVTLGHWTSYLLVESLRQAISLCAVAFLSSPWSPLSSLWPCVSISEATSQKPFLKLKKKKYTADGRRTITMIFLLGTGGVCRGFCAIEPVFEVARMYSWWPRCCKSVSLYVRQGTGWQKLSHAEDVGRLVWRNF